MFTKEEVIRELQMKNQQKDELVGIVAKEKIARELAESKLWVGPNALNFKEMGATTDKMRGMVAKQHMLANYPQTYENKLQELHEVEGRIKFLYKILDVMIAFGVDKIDENPKRAQKASVSDEGNGPSDS